VTGATAGVYNVATPQRFRARGYGEALTWAAIDEGATRDCRVAILQSSDAGYPIYKRMGFVEIGRYLQLEGPPVETA
jgi:predicted acetyltransferase